MKRIEEAKFVIVLSCRDCGQELNRTHDLPTSDIYGNWWLILMSGGLCAGRCPKGCRSTFSDVNINTASRIVDAQTGKPFHYDGFKFLHGKFYSDDYTRVCVCPDNAGDRYVSDRYPEIHGPCGHWIVPFESSLRKSVSA